MRKIYYTVCEEEIHKILQEMPELPAKVFTLYHILNKNVRLISKELGISQSEVKSLRWEANWFIMEKSGCEEYKRAREMKYLIDSKRTHKPRIDDFPKTYRYAKLNFKISEIDLHKSISEMPELTAKVFKLYYLDNKKQKDIVRELNIPLCRVMSERTKGRFFIRNKFGLMEKIIEDQELFFKNNSMSVTTFSFN